MLAVTLSEHRCQHKLYIHRNEFAPHQLAESTAIKIMFDIYGLVAAVDMKFKTLSWPQMRRLLPARPKTQQCIQVLYRPTTVVVATH